MLRPVPHSFMLKIEDYDNSVLSGNYYEEISTISLCKVQQAWRYWLAQLLARHDHRTILFSYLDSFISLLALLQVTDLQYLID